MRSTTIFMIASLSLILSGCRGDYIAELEDKVSELEEMLILREDELEKTISSHEESIGKLQDTMDDLEDENDFLKEREEFRMEVLNGLPYYLRDILDYPYVELVPKPDNSFLLVEEKWSIGGYSVFVAEEGMCELAFEWVLLETDTKVYKYMTNGGCNPDWIGEPLYVRIDDSLLSVPTAISMGYLSEQDLIESSKVYSENKD